MAKRNVSPRRKIKKFLKEKRQTQTWLAAEVGLSLSGMNDIIRGRRRPSLVVASKLEAIVGIPASEFANAS